MKKFPNVRLLIPFPAKLHLACVFGGLLVERRTLVPGKLVKATSKLLSDMLQAVPTPSPPRVCSQKLVPATRVKVPLSCVPMMEMLGVWGEVAME